MPIKNYQIILLIVLLSTGFTTGQSPYKYSFGVDGGIAGVTAFSIGANFLLDKKVEPLTQEELAQLDRSNIWKVDQWSIDQNSYQAHRVSNGFLYGSQLLPLTLLADQPSRGDFGKVGVFYLEAFLLNAGITNLTKVLVKRERPFLYHDIQRDHFKRNGKRSRYSFFSGHTSATAVATFLTAKMYQDYYPNSDGKTVVWSLAAAIPAITGYTRMRAGKHFFTDVLVGYIVGAGIGILVPELHK